MLSRRRYPTEIGRSRFCVLAKHDLAPVRIRKGSSVCAIRIAIGVTMLLYGSRIMLKGSVGSSRLRVEVDQVLNIEMFRGNK